MKRIYYDRGKETKKNKGKDREEVIRRKREKWEENRTNKGEGKDEKGRREGRGKTW